MLILHLSAVNILQVEIEVMEDGAIEVETGLEEVVNTAKSSEEGSDDSALALLADITSKYQHGESTLHVVKKDGIDEVRREALLEALHFRNADIAQMFTSLDLAWFALCRKWFIKRKRWLPPRY